MSKDSIPYLTIDPAIEEQIRTDREAGEKIVIKRLENQNEEARYIVNRITEL